MKPSQEWMDRHGVLEHDVAVAEAFVTGAGNVRPEDHTYDVAIQSLAAILASERMRNAGRLADLTAVAAELEPDAVRALTYLAKRLLAGKRQYGAIDLATDKRDFRKERGEEIADLLVYTAFGELQATVARG